VPATAVLKDKINRQINLYHKRHINTLEVQVGGESWIVGLNPSLVDGERELNDKYVYTETYKALFYASLVQGIFHCRIIEVVPLLQTMNALHSH
jgi:hypothetical protein